MMDMVALNNLAAKVSQTRKVTMQKMKQNLKLENINKVTFKSVITGCDIPNVDNYVHASFVDSV